MGLSTAERNRRKRERKKKEKEARRKEEEAEREKREKEAKEKTEAKENDEEEVIEIEYVGENPSAVQEGMQDVFERFQARASVQTQVVTDEEKEKANSLTRDDSEEDEDDSDDDDETAPGMSKRQLRKRIRPSVADLKRRVKRPDLVEAHDVTACNAEFLIHLKGIAGTVPVPRHWGRKRKYLQGKRGFEKPPFQLPEFIVKTGITEIRDALVDAENDLTTKQKNRARVAPKMGRMDVDYRTLHDAFFKYQTKPPHLTSLGDLYYEGKEMEMRNTVKPGGPLSPALRQALGMTSDTAPPPWLLNMQRYGPPPSYPTLVIPGLNAPLPSTQCQFGYHVGGWGKPPVDQFNRPLYGGNPFDPPAGSNDLADRIPKQGFVTSDGKTVVAKEWGALPTQQWNEDDDDEDDDEEKEEEEESSDEEMQISDGEEVEEEKSGMESVLPTPQAAPTDLRKQQAGTETPFTTTPANEEEKTRQLYTILEQQKATGQSGQVFGSEIAYKMPPEGAESVLSKQVAEPASNKKRKRGDEDDNEGDFGKNFKF